MKKIVMEYTTDPIDISFISGGYEECESTQSVGPLTKQYDILHFVLSGKGHYYVDNQHYLIEKGDCFYTPENTSVFYHADSVSPWSYCWICFNGLDAKKTVNNWGLTLNTPVTIVENYSEIYATVLKMLDYYKVYPANDWFIQSFLIHIFALIQTESKQEYSKIDLLQNPLMIEAIKFIQTTPLNELTVKSVSDYLHISRTYLFKLFKEELNISPQQFLKNAKISNSCELMAKSKLSVQEVGDRCGYSNQFAFSRAFKRETSLTPSEYRSLYTRPSELLDC